MQGRGKREVHAKTRRPAASSGMIPTWKNPGATSPGIKPDSPMWEASNLATTRRGPYELVNSAFIDYGRLWKRSLVIDGRPHALEGSARLGGLPTVKKVRNYGERVAGSRYSAVRYVGALAAPEDSLAGVDCVPGVNKARTRAAAAARGARGFVLGKVTAEGGICKDPGVWCDNPPPARRRVCLLKSNKKSFEKIERKRGSGGNKKKGSLERKASKKMGQKGMRSSPSTPVIFLSRAKEKKSEIKEKYTKRGRRRQSPTDRKEACFFAGDPRNALSKSTERFATLSQGWVPDPPSRLRFVAMQHSLCQRSLEITHKRFACLSYKLAKSIEVTSTRQRNTKNALVFFLTATKNEDRLAYLGGKRCFLIYRERIMCDTGPPTIQHSLHDSQPMLREEREREREREIDEGSVHRLLLWPTQKLTTQAFVYRGVGLALPGSHRRQENGLCRASEGAYSRCDAKMRRERAIAVPPDGTRGENDYDQQTNCGCSHQVKAVHDEIDLPVSNLFPSFETEKSCSHKGETATHIKCTIAAKRKALNWRAVFSSHCVYLMAFRWLRLVIRKHCLGASEDCNMRCRVAEDCTQYAFPGSCMSDELDLWRQDIKTRSISQLDGRSALFITVPSRCHGDATPTPISWPWFIFQAPASTFRREIAALAGRKKFCCPACGNTIKLQFSGSQRDRSTSSLVVHDPTQDGDHGADELSTGGASKKHSRRLGGEEDEVEVDWLAMERTPDSTPCRERHWLYTLIKLELSKALSNLSDGARVEQLRTPERPGKALRHDSVHQTPETDSGKLIGKKENAFPEWDGKVGRERARERETAIERKEEARTRTDAVPQHSAIFVQGAEHRRHLSDFSLMLEILRHAGGLCFSFSFCSLSLSLFLSLHFPEDDCEFARSRPPLTRNKNPL
ncbi:hypothetical protein PR048_019478 [Dryococelus australis]|uniref:Uncharacterized protein n=1 Tax=Dryococelus australis TaxID=614101 RepID=A0ABQ9H3K5_9NEOP|nr:hypothetical protein PR048_019478 [Dryococelus australis]